MKFFLDSASLVEIREAASQGLIDGVTTNPSLIAKERIDFRKRIEEICQVVDGPISAEVIATDYEGMLQEGTSLAKLHKNVVVKLPMTPEGIRVTHRLSQEGIHVNVTLIFSAAQALLAAKAGATYVSPFIGRLDDVGQFGLGLIDEIVTIFSNYSFATEVLVASIRSPLHVIEAAKIGAGVATMPFSVLQQLFKHPLTDMGLAKFLSDWEKSKVS